MKYFYDSLARACFYLSMVCLITITAIIGWQVFARYVLNDSPVWSEPLAMLLLLYGVLIGGAVGIREQTHLGLIWFRKKLSAKKLTAILFIEWLIVGFVAGAMMYYGGLMMRQTANYPIAGLPFNMCWQYFALVLSGSVITCFVIEKIVGALRPQFHEEST